MAVLPVPGESLRASRKERRRPSPRMQGNRDGSCQARPGREARRPAMCARAVQPRKATELIASARTSIRLVPLGLACHRVDTSGLRLNELLDVIFRWAHLIAGIMWIGNSMLFNWLDRNLEKHDKL